MIGQCGLPRNEIRSSVIGSAGGKRPSEPLVALSLKLGRAEPADLWFCGYRVCGIDPSPELLVRAHERLPNARVPVLLVRASAEQLGKMPPPLNPGRSREEAERRQSRRAGTALVRDNRQTQVGNAVGIEA